MHQYRDLGMREYLDRLAAEDDRGDAVAAVRGHDDKVTAFRLRGLDDRLVGMLMLDIDCVVCDARCSCCASTDAEIDAAFTTLTQQGTVALLVTEDPFLGSRNERLVALAARDKLPTIYYNRTFVEIGGFASYGANFVDGFRGVRRT
jgi:hypothetical protein